MKTVNTDQKMTIQLWLGVILAFSGLIFLGIGMWLPPIGIIDSSVLVAYGEVSTFSGGLIGIDYNYKYKMHKIGNHEELHHHNNDYPIDEQL